VSVTCALCGFSYEPGGSNCRTRGCPLAVGHCRFAHCPRCAYTVPAEDAGLAGWLRRTFTGRRSRGGSAPCRLTDLGAGSHAVVERVDAAPDVAGLLTLLGVTPGSQVLLCQRVPGYVVQVDGSELAFEAAVAETVWVRPAQDSAPSKS